VAAGGRDIAVAQRRDLSGRPRESFHCSRRRLGTAVVGGRESPDSGQRYPEALPWLCKSEGEVRAEPRWEKWRGGSAVAALNSERGWRWWRRRISGEERCSDGGGGQKSNGEGGFTRGVLQRLDGGGEKNRGTAAQRPFEAEAGEAGEGWGVRVRPREGGGRLRFDRAMRRTKWGWWGLAQAGARGRWGRAVIVPSWQRARGQGMKGVRARSRHAEEDDVGGAGSRRCADRRHLQPAGSGWCGSVSRLVGAGEWCDTCGLRVSTWAARGKEGAGPDPREQCQF
jgi:hypothetical protein